MVHVIFMRYSTPEGHKDFVKKVQHELSYDYSGKIRHGKHQPLISEIKFYDVRIKKELVPELMNDLRIMDKGGNPAGPWYSGHYQGFISKLIRVGRWFLRLKNPPWRICR